MESHEPGFLPPSPPAPPTTPLTFDESTIARGDAGANTSADVTSITLRRMLSLTWRVDAPGDSRNFTAG